MRNNRIAVAAAAFVAATALVACDGDGDKTDGSEPATEGSQEAVIEMTDQPGSVDGYEGALEDAELETCEPQAGFLAVAGTVSNPEADDHDYRIYVSAMDGGDTRGIVQLDVENVVAGETVEWSTEVELSDEDLECVLRVERFPSD